MLILFIFLILLIQTWLGVPKRLRRSAPLLRYPAQLALRVAAINMWCGDVRGRCITCWSTTHAIPPLRSTITMRSSYLVRGARLFSRCTRHCGRRARQHARRRPVSRGPSRPRAVRYMPGSRCEQCSRARGNFKSWLLISAWASRVLPKLLPKKLI